MHFPDSLFWLLFAGVGLFFAFKVIRRGGFKAAMFNAEIERGVGEIQTVRGTVGSQVIRVHALRRDGQRLIGLELVSKSIGSYEMVPLTLAPEQARSLISLLQEASV